MGASTATGAGVGSNCPIGGWVLGIFSVVGGAGAEVLTGASGADGGVVMGAPLGWVVLGIAVGEPGRAGGCVKLGSVVGWLSATG